MADLRSTSPNIKIMYLSPEDLKTQEKQDLLNKLYCANQLSMFAIDECHCISSWGHEFRPAYLQLSNLKARFSKVPIMALTATATPEVRNDICHLLFGDEASTSSSSSSSSSSFPSHSLMPASTASREKGKLKLIVENFDRPNIVYFVKYKETIKDINANIINFVAKFRNESGMCVRLNNFFINYKDIQRLQPSMTKVAPSPSLCSPFYLHIKSLSPTHA